MSHLGTPASATVTLQDLPSDDWLYQQFGPEANNPAVASPMVDADSDGLTNLEEYAFGTNGNGSDTAPITLDTTPIGPDDFLRLTVTKNPAATDVTIEVQSTTELANELSWTSVGLVIEEDSPTILRVRHNTPTGTGPPRFMRVRVTKP